MILKFDEGIGVVLLNKVYYYDVSNWLLSDKVTFKIIKDSQGLTRLKTVTNCYNHLL